MTDNPSATPTHGARWKISESKPKNTETPATDSTTGNVPATFTGTVGTPKQNETTDNVDSAPVSAGGVVLWGLVGSVALAVWFYRKHPGKFAEHRGELKGMRKKADKKQRKAEKKAKRAAEQAAAEGGAPAVVLPAGAPPMPGQPPKGPEGAQGPASPMDPAAPKGPVAPAGPVAPQGPTAVPVNVPGGITIPFQPTVEWRNERPPVHIPAQRISMDKPVQVQETVEKAVENFAASVENEQMTLALPTEILVPTEEEQELFRRLDPDYWKDHAKDRNLDKTYTKTSKLTRSGIECVVELGGPWTEKKLRNAIDNVGALLGIRSDVHVLVGPGDQKDQAILRLRTRSAAPDGVIIWQPGDAFGIDTVTGEEVDIPLGHRMLVAGISGSGKSTASRAPLYYASAGPDHVLVIIDLKMVEGRLWDHRARVAYTVDQINTLVEELVEELNERLAMLPKGMATLVPSADWPRITVVVDEGAEVISKCKDYEQVVGYTDGEDPKEIIEKINATDGLETIARMGRAACIDLWWMTQSPTYGDGVPRQIAKQLGLRIGLAVESPSEARVVFGEAAQEKGWKADELPMPGVAMVRVPGNNMTPHMRNTPNPVKVRQVTDEAVVAFPSEPIWRRGTSGKRSAPLSRPVEKSELLVENDFADMDLDAVEDTTLVFGTNEEATGTASGEPQYFESDGAPWEEIAAHNAEADKKETVLRAMHEYGEEIQAKQLEALVPFSRATLDRCLGELKDAYLVENHKHGMWRITEEN